MKRVTYRDLAKKLGLSPSAISLALRNHRSLPLATRERVQKLAAELGYRPDPALASLNAYRHANRNFKYQATLAWINAYPDKNTLRSSIAFEACFQGAQTRAAELGYNLEEFWVPSPEQWRPLLKVLKSRRIEGLMLPPRDETNQDIAPSEDFHAVGLGEPTRPPLHLIINDQFQSAALAVRELNAKGYRKIGIVMPIKFARRTDFHFLGGYRAECDKLGLRALVHLEECPVEEFKKHTVTWLRKNKPEVVIAPGDQDILPALKEAKMKVSRDIAVAFLHRFPGYPEIAGIDQNEQQIGIAGANHLIDLIRRNERGIPESPLRILISGTWVDGASAPGLR